MIETLRTWRLLSSLRASSGRSPEELETLQRELLRAAVANAYENIPFYRRCWDEHGFDAAALRDIGDVERMPILGGREVREAALRGELLARGVETSRCTMSPTSGWSGAPLPIWRRAVEQRAWRAAGLRMQFEHGYRWRDRSVQFDAPPASRHLLQRLGVGRTTWIPHALPLDDQLARFVEAGAEVVVGTPTVLRRLCRALEAATSDWTRPRTVFCQGEVLDAQTRGTIRRVLGPDPVSLYGLTELGYVAWQCEERQGLHVNAELVLVEVLRDGRPAPPGELGTVVVTNLRGRTMPFLRYDTGDLAVAGTGPCRCGRSLPVLGSVEGRLRNSILLADGRILTTSAMLDHLAGCLPLGAYRLHQEALGRFRLTLSPRGDGDGSGATGRDGAHADDGIAERRLREILGDVEIAIERATTGRSEGSLKTHAISSEVPIDLR